ncbi:hypothetical protein PIB30_114595, partial [Stylosanthes scabra]|nr:hypothetical protein [Stylosanthes scabra]
MESTRLLRPVQRRQQENEDEDEPMPQAEEGNEGQTHDYDYHHQPDMSIINTTMSSRNPNSNITKSSMNH